TTHAGEASLRVAPPFTRLLALSLRAFEPTRTIGALVASPRVVVDLQRFLRWPLRLGDVTQIDPDASPRGVAPPHRIHHDIRWREVRPDLGMTRPPALQPGTRFGFRCGASD